ncbi:MAG TPA: hypothetical protein VL968_08940 [Rhodocyclaceae bacterium]|nr:hypothetical protein [Rhodocyclaceae bacterium]
MEYDCIGVCTPDPLSGLCQGCGRPLVESPAPAAAKATEPVTEPGVISTAPLSPCSSS